MQKSVEDKIDSAFSRGSLIASAAKSLAEDFALLMRSDARKDERFAVAKAYAANSQSYHATNVIRIMQGMKPLSRKGVEL